MPAAMCTPSLSLREKNIGTFKSFVELNALLGMKWILFNRIACGGSCLADYASLAPSPADIQRTLDESVPVAVVTAGSLSFSLIRFIVFDPTDRVI
jgi:hypothetical protein